MDLPSRKHPRLKNYDYSHCGCYHITICVKNRKPILSRIICANSPAGRSRTHLSRIGRMVEQYIQNIPNVYRGISLDKYVIMPNHIHLLLSLDSEASVSVPTVVRSLKRMVTRELGESIWQDSFYDVVIRNDTMYQCEWAYIDTNPDKWAEDELFAKDSADIV